MSFMVGFLVLNTRVSNLQWTLGQYICSMEKKKPTQNKTKKPNKTAVTFKSKKEKKKKKKFSQKQWSLKHSQTVSRLWFNQPYQGEKEKASKGSEEEQKQNCTAPSSSENRISGFKVVSIVKPKLLIRKNIQTLHTWKLFPSLLKQGR